MLSASDLTKLERLREEFYSYEFGLKLLNRMSLNPTEDGALEECRGISTLFNTLKRLYVDTFREIEALEKLEELGQYKYPESRLQVNMSNLTKKAIERTEATQNATPN